MSVELVRDIVNYEKLVGEAASQTMVNGDIVLPERNPEFETILNRYGKAIVVSSEVMNDSVMVEGKIVFDILYSSPEDVTNIHKTSATSNFNHTLQVPGALPSMSCKVDAYVENLQYELLSNKKVKVNAVISIRGRVYEKETLEFITDIKGEEVQLLKDSRNIDELIGENSGQSIVKGKIMIPEEKGEVKGIIKSHIHIHKKDVTIQEGKVIINACALARIAYESTLAGICYEEQDVAFTHEMELPEIKPGMKCDVDFKIQDAFEEIKEDENDERKIIEIEVALGINVIGYMPRDIITIEDAYSSKERYDFDNAKVKAVSLCGEGIDSQTLKEKISIPEDKQKIGVIKHVDANAVPTDIKVVEDKLVIEGIVGCSIIYVGASEDSKITSHYEEIPFKSLIDVPGAKFDMFTEVKSEIEHISFNRASDMDADIKLIIGCNAKVFGRISMDIVKAVEEVDISENIKNMPSLTIYTIQTGDTLWKIAKKYSATVDDIAGINEIVDTENIEPGKKILIPKKMFMK